MHANAQARATRGVHSGTWYFEMRVVHLGSSGHCRLGWSTKRGELQAPVGYDEHSVGYRDLEGSKLHRALREDYGAPYAEVGPCTPPINPSRWPQSFVVHGGAAWPVRERVRSACHTARAQACVLASEGMLLATPCELQQHCKPGWLLQAEALSGRLHPIP
jgi:hypothetical protein